MNSVLNEEHRWEHFVGRKLSFKQRDEEMLCPWGKIYRKKGDTALSIRADVTQAIQDVSGESRRLNRPWMDRYRHDYDLRPPTY
jgi:hypothetical protein